MKNILAILIVLFSMSVFAEAITELEITHPESKTEMQSLIFSSGTSKHVVINSLINYLKAMRAGGRNAKFDLQVGQGALVAASGQVIFTGVPTAADTVVIAGTTLTAVAQGSTPTYGTEFEAGASAAEAAGNLAGAININTTLKAFLTGSRSSNSTVITSDVKGTIGNGIALSESLDNATVSGALLTGGVDATANEYKFGY